MILLSTGVISAFSWTSNYTTALEQAKAQKKLVLLSFTGDDPYGYGGRLNSEVLTQTTFVTYADKNYILVAVDVSANSPLPKDRKERNAALVQQFHINGFPTLVLAGSDGKEIGRQEGYDPSAGPDAVIAKLKNLSGR